MLSTKNFLILVILGSFFFVIIKFYSFYTEYSGMQYADWLINYQGGLVRRGLIGEVLFKFHKIFLIDLDLLIFIFVVLLYSIFTYYLLRSLKYIKSSYENLLIILSPGFFLYPVMNSQVVGRKEIFFISLFSSLIFLEKKIHQKLLLPIFIISIVILSLSHSGFVFYVPYFLVLYFLIKSNRELIFNLLDFFIFIFVMVCLIFFIQFFNGTQLHIEKICESVSEFASKNCGQDDQISFLDNTIKNYFFEKFLDFKLLKNYLLIYTISIFFVFFFISLKLLDATYTSKFYLFKKFNPFFVICTLFIFTLPVYILTLDWGRYIYISYSITFFLYIYCLKNKILNFNYLNFFNRVKFNKISLIIFVFFYSFFWTFPFYGAKNFKLVFEKPIKSILKKIN